MSDITHVKTVGRVQWTRYSDGVWKSKVGKVFRVGARDWGYSLLGIERVHDGYHTMGGAMWVAISHSSLRRSRQWGRQ